MIRLRPAKYNDLEWIVQMEQSNPEFIATYDLETHKRLFNQGDNRYLIVQGDTDSSILGFVLLSGLENKDDSIEFRRIVITDKNNGYGQVTIELIIDYCFKELRANRLWLDVISKNNRAIHVYQKNGFRKEGLIRDCFKHANGYHSLIIMSILAADYTSDYRIIRASSTTELDIVKLMFKEYQNEIEADLCFQSFEQELSTLPGKYSYPEGELLLIKDIVDNIFVGCVGLRPIDKYICEMKRLYVKPSYRSKKYGLLLANSILVTAQQLGYKEMCLDTLDKLTAAIGLYNKLGFIRTNSYYENPLDGVVYMKKELV